MIQQVTPTLAPPQLFLHSYELIYLSLKPLELVPHPHELVSVLRGALHRCTTLRFCRRPNPSGRKCSGCRCIYGKLFDPKAPSDHIHASKFRRAPVPYTIQVLEARRHYKQGDHLRFQLNLFGKANEVLPDLIRLLQQLTERFPHHSPFSFRLLAINEIGEHQGQKKQLLYYDGLLHPAFLKYRRGSVPIGCFSNKVFTLSLAFRQMCCFYQKDNPVLLPSFKMLIKRVWERVWIINSFYGDKHYPESAPDWDAILEYEPEAIPQDLEIVKWCKKKTRRYNKNIPAHEREVVVGFKGQIQYKSKKDLVPWLPLLSLGQQMGIGKMTGFGLGQFKLKIK